MTQQEIEALEKEADGLYDAYWEMRKRIEDEKIKNISLDIERKFVRYRDKLSGDDEYCFVDWVTEDKRRFQGFKYVYRISGLGFHGSFVGYEDATYFTWDYTHEFHIFSNDIDEFRKMVESIEIITQEEFEKAFKECLEKTAEYNTKYLHKKLEEKN